MDFVESLDVNPSSFYKTRCRLKQRQDLLQAIENVDLVSGRKLIVDRGTPLWDVQPELLSRFLWHAVKVNDSILVDELLNYHPDLSTPMGCEESMLWLAVKNCNMAITLSLISAGADLSEKLLSNQNKPSFLHAVIMWWEKPIVTKIALHMIKHGADVNARDAQGNSVLHTAMLWNVDFVIVEKLLENGADIHAVNNDGHNLLLAATYNENSDELIPILVGYNADEATKKQRAMIALQYLIITNNDQKLDAFRLLLGMNVPINALDEGGLALIHWAVSIGGNEAVKILLDFGADVNIKSKGGTIPLLEAAKLSTSCIARLLIANGADIQLCHDDGRHPIHAACAEASLQNIHFFLRLGADLNTVDKAGCTPFSYLHLKKANSDCIKLVLEYLALLQARDVKIHEANLAIIENNYSVKSYYKNCLSELQKMKEIKVYNNIPFFCFLSKSIVELSKLIKNDDLVDSYKRQYEFLFPLYTIQMKYAFVIAEKANNMLVYYENTLSEIFLGVISHLVVEKIAGYLCYDKLNNLQRDFHFSLHESIDQGETGYGKNML